MEILTAKRIIEESNFNYLYPQASLSKIEKTDNTRYVKVDDELKILNSLIQNIEIYGFNDNQFEILRRWRDELSSSKDKVN